MTLIFTVVGRPQPGGSKRGFYIPKLKRVVLGDANEKAKPWQAEVRAAAAAAFSGPLLTGAVRLDVAFFLARPKGHFRTGRHADQLRDAAPRFHTQKPDRTKLVRCLEDALTGVIWRDDTQVVGGDVTKDWTIERERAEVVITLLDALGAGGQLALGAGVVERSA